MVNASTAVCQTTRNHTGLRTIKKILLAQSCPTLCNPLDYSLPGSFHGVFQARILE